MQTPHAPRKSARCATAQWRTGARMACTVMIASCLLPEAEAVFLSLGALVQAQHQIRIRVGSDAAGVDTVNFGSIDGTKVGNGQSVAGQGGSGVDLWVSAWTPGDGDRVVTVTANSAMGLSCTSSSSCGTTTIPFDTVSWTVGSAATANGGGDVQPGKFNMSSAQPIARFASARQLKSTLFFRYANSTVYPAGTYTGRVTFTASMP
jgi:hypothetical protein